MCAITNISGLSAQTLRYVSYLHTNIIYMYSHIYEKCICICIYMYSTYTCIIIVERMFVCTCSIFHSQTFRACQYGANSQELDPGNCQILKCQKKKNLDVYMYIYMVCISIRSNISISVM